MKRTIEVLNELERAGVLSRYAIGGAMGAIFYPEPFLTFDVGVFVVLPQPAGGLVSLTGIYGEPRRCGYTEAHECIVIEGVPVQFLPAYNALVEEALKDARQTDYEGVPTRVLCAEHLVAICLQTGRVKDRARVAMLREQAKLDRAAVADILKRHQLEERWKEWTT